MLIEAGDYDQAEDVVNGFLARRMRLTDADVVELLGYKARIQRLRGKPARAIQLLQSAQKKAASGSPLWRLEMGAALLATKRTDDAASHLEAAANASWKSPLLRASAKLEYAKLQFAQAAYKPCMATCGVVLKIKSERTEEDLTGYQQTARELKAQAHDAWLLAEFGRDYYHYRRGRESQAAGKYDAAIRHYARISPGMMQDAGRCYTVASLLALGDRQSVREALVVAKAFDAAEPLGLYRGEVRLTLARAQMIESRGATSMQRAYDSLAALLEWQLAVAKAPEVAEMENVKAVVTRFPVPNAIARKNDMGSLVRIYAGPETIVNRLTSPWYLPEQQLDASLLMVLAATMVGDRDTAREAVHRVNSLDVANGGSFDVRDGVPDALLDGVERGAFLVTPGVWNGMSSAHSGRLRMASFLALAGRTAQAEALYKQSRARSEDHRMNRNDQSALHYGMAVCRFDSGDITGAIEELNVFRKELRSGSMRYEALLMQANLLAGIEDQQDEADSLYRGLAKRDDRAFSARVLLCHAIFAVNTQRNELAVSLAKRLATIYKNEPAGAAGRNLYNRLTDADGAVLPGLPRPDASGVDRPGGRLIAVKRHLVFPGGGDLSVRYDDIAARDVLHYAVSASTAADCVILRQFTLRFTRFEPQIRPVAGHHGSFLRAPILYSSMLWRAQPADPTRSDLISTNDKREMTWQATLGRYIENGDAAAAQAYLRKLLAGMELAERERTLMSGALAGLMRDAGDAAAGLELLESLPQAEQVVPPIRLEMGRLYLDLGQLDDAKARLAPGIHDPTPAIKGGSHLALARLYVQAKEFDSAAKHALIGTRIHPDPAAQDEARKLLGEAEREHLVTTYGDGFFLYVQGRRAHLAGRYDEAVTWYKQVDAPMLRDAARCYGVACLRRLGRHDDATKAAGIFLKDHGFNAYRSELSIDLATHLLLSERHSPSMLQACRELLVSAVAELAVERPPTEASAPGIVPIIRAFPPSSRFLPPGHPRLQAPELLLNPVTSGWYGRQLSARGQLLLAFVDHEVKGDEPGKHVTQALAQIDALGLSTGPLLRRLTAGLEAESFVLPDAAWDGVDTRWRGQLRAACFLAIAGSGAQAERTLQGVIESEHSSVGDRERQLARLILAELARRHDEPAEMQAHLDFLDAKPSQRAILDMAFLMQQLPQGDAK